jgi:hypothetical protein
MEQRVKDELKPVESFQLRGERKTYEALHACVLAIQGCQDAMRAVMEAIKALEERTRK